MSAINGSPREDASDLAAEPPAASDPAPAPGASGAVVPSGALLGTVLEGEAADVLDRARARVTGLFSDRSHTTAPATPPADGSPAAKAAAIQRLISGGSAALHLLQSVLPGHESVGDQVIDILRTCGSAADLDAVLTRVGRQSLLSRLDVLDHGRVGEVTQLIEDIRASDLRSGDWSAYDRYLDQVTGTTATAGNRVTLLDDGAQAFPAFYAAIDGAQSSINLESYQIGGDATGREYAQHLIDAARRGVTVNVLTDKQANLQVGGQAIIDLLRRNGVNVIEHEGEALMASMDHRKILIVDGTTGFCGGMNIGDMYARGQWHDMHAKLEGPAVADLQHAFLSHWSADGGEVPAGVDYFPPLATVGGEPVRVVGHVGAGGDENLRMAYLRAIDTAQTSIRIEDPFFDDREIITHLEAAARRGVDVELVWPGGNADPTAAAVARANYGNLIAAGAKIYEIPGMAHEKVCAIDGQFATVGSSNLDERSLRKDWEMNLVTVDPAFAGRLAAAIDADIARSQPITQAPAGIFDPLLRTQAAEDSISILP